ncbi:peptidylprolyl isomerase [Sulfitobacter pacificus]|uniref:Parvulin-like PPIase n=1 Tax=Sulfitobacter pacificus TaxID=1499314 RepID=A0ABQ5VMJ0_9RHOB|nr:peptidylprolyl isomerase [Sulfitobacter pacificus]GLQ28249.1 peptidylprolyl isomerase [Sulfitobacter pacificus]
MQKPLTYLASLALAVTLALPVTAEDKPNVDTVVATVNGKDITLGHMIIARATLPQQYQDLPDEVLYKGILDQLVQQTALADTHEGDLPKRVTLSLENETRSLTAGEVIEGVMAAPVEEDAIKAAYDAQYKDQEAGEEYNASHILVETKEEADAIKEALDEGADFAELAREKSTGPSGPGGGSLGWFGAGMMVPTFEAAVVEMEPGAVSAPVETQFGWHVIKLNETRKTKAPQMEDVREELELQVRQTLVQTRIEEITEKADVDLMSEQVIDPALIKNIDWLE